MHIVVSSHAAQQPIEIWNAWKQEHTKIYVTAEEESKRFAVFQDNLNYINTYNAAGKSSVVLGINSFSDMKFEEWREKFLRPFPEEIIISSPDIMAEEVAPKDLPQSE